MISLLLSFVFAPAKVVELVEPNADSISIQALVSLPDLGAKDLARLNLIVSAIPKQTLDYPRREMLIVTDGEPVRCNITPDHVRVVVNVPPDHLKAGLGVMEALLRNATLTAENLEAAKEEQDEPDYWSSALNPIDLPKVKLTAEEAQQLYHRVFRPDRLLLTVGGRFAQGDAEQAWTKRMALWPVEKEPKGFFDNTPIAERTKGSGAITTVDLVAAPFSANETGVQSKILSMFAFGVGKRASLFRVVREKHGWSYRQEAILSPTKDGFVPHLLVAMIPTDDAQDRAKTMRTELLEDVGTWDSTTRDRAFGMAEAVLSGYIPFNPFYFLGDSPAGNSLEDRTFLSGYWKMKTGTRWNPGLLLDSMKKVSVDELKESAKAMLATVIPRILPGG